MTIHLLNGDYVYMPRGNFQTREVDGNISYYNNDKKDEWIGTLTKAGHFVDPGGKGTTIQRYKGDDIHSIIGRLKRKETFSYRENDDLMTLKRLLGQYIPKQGRYK